MRMFLGGKVILFNDDCLNAMKNLPENSVDAIVTDPPYHLQSIVKRYGNTSIDADGTNERRAKAGADAMARLSRGFMGKEWDGGDIAFNPETWELALRVLKPGGHLAAFSGTRTYHRMAVAIEDAGFEIRDQLAWAYGSGFPKSLDVSKAIDKAAGAEREKVATGAPIKRMIPGADQDKTGSWIKDTGRVYQPAIEIPATDSAKQWSGWGTALKPAWEPICLARKPLSEKTVAENVLRWGCGALNIDGCRIGTERREYKGGMGRFNASAQTQGYRPYASGVPSQSTETFVAEGRWPANLAHDGSDEVVVGFPNDSARYFYCPKASAKDRIGSKHPTVKPVALLQWLVRLVTPPGGVVLDPFSGTGTTGAATVEEGFMAMLIEREAEYVEDIARRMKGIEDERRTKD